MCITSQTDLITSVFSDVHYEAHVQFSTVPPARYSDTLGTGSLNGSLSREYTQPYETQVVWIGEHVTRPRAAQTWIKKRRKNGNHYQHTQDNCQLLVCAFDGTRHNSMISPMVKYQACYYANLIFSQVTRVTGLHPDILCNKYIVIKNLINQRSIRMASTVMCKITNPNFKDMNNISTRNNGLPYQIALSRKSFTRS